jgi:Holliday junction DNA helicase RuvA
MLSSMSSEEVRTAILSEDLAKIKSVKGVGLKTAQKIIIELKDKIVKGEGSSLETLPGMGRHENVEEATRALIMLGFSKPVVSKAIQKVLKDNNADTVEELIKATLKLV